MGIDYATILFDASTPIARITLNRPEKRNPIGPQVIGELMHALAAAREEPSVRVVVLTGAGSVFSAGGDLGMMAGQGASASSSPAPPRRLAELLPFMHALGKPIIAMVNGHALAGGLGLMVACDLVVASDQASFGTTEIKVGLWPMMITAELVRNIGRKKTLELMLTGKRIEARQAEAIGLINVCVAHEALEETTMKLAHQLAEQSPAAMALGLRAFYDTQDQPHEPALGHLEAELGKVLALEDAAEGISAFFQKRQPHWKGR